MDEENEIWRVTTRTPLQDHSGVQYSVARRPNSCVFTTLCSTVVASPSTMPTVLRRFHSSPPSSADRSSHTIPSCSRMQSGPEVRRGWMEVRRPLSIQQSEFPEQISRCFVVKVTRWTLSSQPPRPQCRYLVLCFPIYIRRWLPLQLPQWLTGV